MTARQDWSRLLSNVPLPEQNVVGIAAGMVLQRVLPLRLGGTSGLPPLVTAGPYALSRNPMYVGWALVHLGAGLLRNDAWVVVALPVAFAAVHRGVRREEEALAASFPAEFSRYRLNVPRYLPGLRPGGAAGTPSPGSRRRAG